MKPLAGALRDQAAAVRLLILDVDGVLTDGRLQYGEGGELLKAFHAHDGLGLRLLRNVGVEVAIISARASAPLRRRVADLRIEHAYLGRDDKLRALGELCEATGIQPKHAAFAGDDVLDLLVMREVGLGITVADGHWRVRQEAAWVTAAAGGQGAVREIADGILDAKDALEESLRVLFDAHVGKGAKLQ